MITVKDFRKSIENVIEYLWDDEEQDFLTQMEDGMPVLHHIFLDLVTLHNALREADGLSFNTLGELLSDRYPDEELGGPIFLCTNEECGKAEYVVDMIPEQLILTLEEGERIPAGCCKHCGGTVVRI